MPYVTSFERLAKQEGIKIGEERGLKKGEERGTNFGQRIGQIQAFEEVLGLPFTSTEELQKKSLEELDLMIGELKANVIR